jgi:hypothetical protein
MRDFIAMKKYINMYINSKYTHYDLYKKASLLIEKLLDNIEAKLSVRKDDYFVFLNDSLPPGNKKYTPFLNSIGKKSLHFKNAWTPALYTTHSIKALMTGKLLIEDSSFNISFKDNLIEHLCKEYKIQFKYFGLLDFEQNDNIIITGHTPASKIYWLAVEYLLNSKRQKFIFMHTIVETHHPWIANNLVNLKSINFMQPDWFGTQNKLSVEYADKQLQWYERFFSQNSTKLYMNDHGNHFVAPPFAMHTRLDISAKWLAHKNVNKFFSYLDFYKLVNMLLNKKLEHIDSLLSDDYIKIQELPFYGKKLVQDLEHIFTLPSVIFGHRGIVTKQAIYMKYADGSEYYRNIKINKHRFSKEELEYLRLLAGNHFPDYNNEKYLEQARILFKSLERYNKRNGSYENEKNYVFSNLLAGIPKEKTIAIRGGGWAGFYILLKLGVEQSQRISFIIDINSKCRAAYFGIPVISPQNAKKTKIDVLLVSFNQDNMDEQLKKEISDFSKIRTVINIYEFLASKGIICTRNFWEREVIEQDWEEK